MWAQKFVALRAAGSLMVRAGQQVSWTQVSRRREQEERARVPYTHYQTAVCPVRGTVPERDPRGGPQRPVKKSRNEEWP